MEPKTALIQSGGKKVFTPLMSALFLAILAGFFGLVSPDYAKAVTYYLDGVYGSDTNPGTSAEPWQSLARAQGALQSGDIVILRNGDYGYFDETLGPGDGRTNWVTYQAQGGHNPVFSQITINASGNTNAYLKFDGITIQLPDPDPWPDPANPPWPKSNCVNINYADYVSLENCNIRGCNKYLSRHGVQIFGSDHITIYRCGISNVGAGTIAIDCNNHTVSYNHIHNMSEGSGVRVQAGVLSPLDVTGTVIKGNHIHQQAGDPGDDYFPDGYHPGSGISIRISNVTIAQNIVHNGFSQGIMFYTDEPGLLPYENMLLENNLFYDTGFNRLRNIGGASLIRNNTFIGCINDDCNNDQYCILARYSGMPLDVSFATGFDGTGVAFFNNIVAGPWGLPNPDTHNYQEDFNIFWVRGDDPYYQYGKGFHTFIAVWRDDTFPYGLRGYPELFENLDLTEITLTPEHPVDEPNVSFFVDPHFYTNKQYPPYATDCGKVCDYHITDDAIAVGFGIPDNQPDRDLGSIDPNGFIFIDSTVRDANHHSAGCYEHGSYQPPPADLAPRFDLIGDKFVYEGSLLAFVVNAVDPDCNDIQYSCIDLPAGADFDPCMFSWTPDPNQADVYPVTFIASDGELQSSEQITITVAEPPSCTPNLMDFAILGQEWGKTGYGLQSDYNNDGRVDELDFIYMTLHWLEYCDN